MSKSKGRRLAEWLRNLDTNSQPAGGGIKDGTISTAKLANDAVTSAKIADSAVATAHLADTGVTFGKLHTALVVTESDGIGSNDNDTTVATSAAIKDYVDAQVAGKDALSELSGDSDDITEGSTNLYFTNERVDDRVNSLLTAGTGITLTYDDAANTLTVTGTGSYSDSDARAAVSVTQNSVGTAALTYSSSTGVFSYTPPDLSSYLTSESDTLDSVTGRGNTTSNSITVANATVTGNLTVQGTTTTLETATLNVEDKNITLNYSTGDSSGSANGAGITIQDAVNATTDATILWNANEDVFDFSHGVGINGNIDISGGYIEKQSSELNGFIVGGYNSIGSSANSKTNPIYAIGSAYLPTSETSVGNFYGIGMTRARGSTSSYLADLDWTLNTGWGLYVAAGSGPTIFLDSTNGDVNWTGNLAHNGTTVMDSSRNLTNIGSITPSADDTYDLGASGTRWANVYTDELTARQSTFTITDTTANSSVNAVVLDYNLSGTDALTADRTKKGLFIDVDSSATGGTTTDEHRIHGLSVDVRATGDSDLLYGTYSYAESQHSAGQISQVTGVLGYAVADDTGTGHTSTIIGVQGLAYGYNTGTGGTSTYHGLYGKSLLSTANDKNTSAATGVYGEVEIDDAGQAQTLTNAYAFQAQIDDDSAGNVTVTNGYLFYGNYAGTQPTNAYGVYIADAVDSYFGGGDVTGIAALTTTGQLNPQTIYVKSNTYTTTSDIGLTANAVIKSGDSLRILSGSSDAIYFGTTSDDAPTTGWQNATAIAAVQADGDFYLYSIGSNTAPSADDLILNGYGLMGNRSSPVYVTNAGTGGVQINADGVHGTSYRVALFDQGGITFDDPLSVTGSITSSSHITAGSTGDVTAYGGATYLSANGIYFESGKHAITKNDGYGNFNIRVGHTHANAEAATETGYIFHDEWSQSSGWRQFNISSASLSVGNTPTWRTQITYNKDDVSLRYQGSEKLNTYSAGVEVTGNLLATSDVTAYYSDERLKDKTGKIENALDKVDAIEAFYYTHNDKAIELGYEGKEQQVGVSAQSVEAVMPEVVRLAPIDNDGNGNSVSGEDYKTVQYDKLVPLLIESIKELKAEIEELKKGR